MVYLAKLRIFKRNVSLSSIVVLYEPKKDWVYLIEAVTSHGPISPKRKFELEIMLERSKAGIIFVTAFPNMSIFKQYADDIASLDFHLKKIILL
ncbi:BsuBI/PstI family type II restriction endonuclease [Alteribacillus sp. HJP-4]|uniref:BsuBI/PstI family type II restriction endonuclease n=1 Tax=Alteribacillus sp. HJP-4 TaxID=2775394 RepID=UPI0035CCDA4A